MPYKPASRHCMANNPKGPLKSYDPNEPLVAKRTMRGGMQPIVLQCVPGCSKNENFALFGNGASWFKCVADK